MVDSYCPDWNLRLHYLLVRSFASVTAHAVSRCELVDGSVVVVTAVNGCAVKVSKRIDDHSVIGKGADLISDALPFGRLWYGEPNAVSNAIDYAKFFSRSHHAVIRVL